MQKKEAGENLNNTEQLAKRISRDLPQVLERETIYTKNELYKLLYPFCKPHRIPVHEVTQALVNFKTIVVYLKGNEKKYSLRPNKDVGEMDKTRFQLLEVKTWLAKTRDGEIQ